MVARRNGYIVLGLSITSIVASIAIFAFGTFQMYEIDVEKEAIFTGRTGDVPVLEYGTYSVFVVSDYTCEEVEVSIYEDDEEMIREYFFRDCDDILDEDGWVYVGYFSTYSDGSLTVEANHQILIIDDIAYFNDGGGAMLISLPVCCIGIIGLIIAVTILITTREQVNGMQTGPEVVFIEPTSTGVVIIEPTNNAEEKEQDNPDENSEWWEK